MVAVKILCIIMFVALLPCTVIGVRPFAIHFDIEPAALPEWNSDFQGITNQYLDLLQAISISKGPLLDLVVDTSNAFNFFTVTRNGVTKELYKWVLDYVDIAMLMDYRNFLAGSSGLLALAQPSVDYATQIGKKVIIGVEVNDVDPAYITFFGTNTSYLEHILGEVKSTFQSKSGFLGVAVHDLWGYQDLEDTQGSGACTSKALFDWDNTIALGSRNDYMQFAKSRCVTTTFFECEWFITSNIPALTQFVSASQSNAMDVHFLYGNHEWAYKANHPYVMTLVQLTSTFVSGLSILPPLVPAPTRIPTPPSQATRTPTRAPTPGPTRAATIAPTATPTAAASAAPTHAAATPSPTRAPTLAPATLAPTRAPTPVPTQASTFPPTRVPSAAPTLEPTFGPASVPDEETGLLGLYYTGINFDTYVASRLDATVNFNWGSSGPSLQGVPVNAFSIKWTGFVIVPVTTTYTFYMTSDDGNCLWVNGVQLSSNWRDSLATYYGSISLTAGVRYPIEIWYYENSGSAQVMLRWSYNSVNMQVVPTDYLYPN